MTDEKRAILLLSGGLDSAVTGAIARRDGFNIHALTFDYGQRHKVELSAARRVAKSLHVAEHIVQTIDLRAFGGSALTSDLAVPKKRDLRAMDQSIPVTYVPARNTIFLAFALGHAETRDAHDIFLGVNSVDFSGYPDCRPEFISAFQQLANVATKAGVRGVGCSIRAPLLNWNKADIIRNGARLGVDFALTHSCYDPPDDKLACGQCDSCLLRREGFRQTGVEDPQAYCDS